MNWPDFLHADGDAIVLVRHRYRGSTAVVLLVQFVQIEVFLSNLK